MSRLGTCVGITNSRLNAAKRGVAVALAARIARAGEAPVCLVGADPTDRDVERHLPRLVSAWGEPSRMEITRGPHRLDVANFAAAHMCVVSVSDRESVELVLPTLQQRFEYLVIDAPSRAGSGVGIADVLLDWLDALVVATGLTAGDLAETRNYVERVDGSPSAQHVDVRVLTVGDAAESGLAPEQLDSRLAFLATIGHVPHARGHATEDAIDSDELDDALRPVVHWIIDGRARRAPTATPGEPPEPESLEHHVANRLYRANTGARPPTGS